MGAVVHPFLVLRVHLKWSRASSEGILNCWKGRAKCVFQHNFFVWNFRMLWKVAFVSFHWQITWIYTPPHRITNHHRDVVRFLGVGNPKLNLKKKLLECWVFGVDPTNHGWFSEIFFRLTKKHIPYPPENCCLEEAIFPLQFGKWCLLAGASFIFLGGYLDRPDFLEPRLIARPKRSLGKAKAVFSNHIFGGEIAVVNRCNHRGIFYPWFLVFVFV